MRTFRYQKSMTAFIGAALKDAGSSMLRAEERIDKLIEDGKDTAGLEEAIFCFKILIEDTENDIVLRRAWWICTVDLMTRVE